MLACVVQIDGFDPVAGVAVSLRASSVDDVAVCHLDGQTWWPAIAKLPTLRYDLFDGAFGGQITAPTSSLTLAVEQWADFGRYALADARLRLWTGNAGDAWGTYVLRFDGRVSEQPQLKDGQAQVSFAVDDRWLDTALLPVYAGTTGAEGPAALKGTAKPLSIGAPRYVPGVLVDSVNSVFQVSFGPIRAILVALERLARFGASMGDYPTFAALVAAAIPPGRWATCLALGLARFGAPPAGQVCFLIQGDNGGPDGWARLPGQVIRRLALISGGGDRIADASLTALDAARPYPVSIYIDQQTTARQLIQQLAASVNAVAGVSWTGKLFVVPVGLATPTMTLAADGSSLPPVGKVEQIGIAAPFSKLAIGAERCWSVHALADIAFAAPLVDRGRYDPAETYREGNIVDLADGSRWLYEAGPPITSAPPGAPWKVLNPATKAADITYADGVTLEDRKPAQKGADVTGDNTAKDTAAVGGRPVAGVLALLDRVTPIEAAQAVLQKAEIDQDAILRQADRDRAKLAAAQIGGLLEQRTQRVTLRDAGMVTDPDTGRIYLYGVDQNERRVSKVEIDLNAATGQIALRTTYNDVQTMITQAQLSPADAAQFGNIIARLNSAEITLSSQSAAIALKADAITVSQLGLMVQSVGQTLDALAGTVSTKVSYSDFTPVRDRVGAVEQTLLSYGDVSSYSLTLRQAELRGDAGTAAGMANLLSGFESGRRQVTRAAEVQQQLYARLVDGDAAEALARLTLSARVGDAEGRIASEEYIRATETSALSRSVDAVSATLGRQGGTVSQLYDVLVTPEGAAARAVLTLAANGRVSGTRQTNDGTTAAFEVLADRFGVFLTNGTRIFYVDADGAIAANFKRDSIGYDNLQLGAVQKAAFFTLAQDVSIARGATTQVVSLTFMKEDADSILEIIFCGDFSSPDDLQFTGTIAIGDRVVKSTRTNIILVDANAAMPITPFAYATGIAAGERTVTFTVTNNESDNAALTIAAGSTIKVVELRKASIGSATGSGATSVSGGSSGGGGNVGGTGSGGTYSGGGRNQNVALQ